MKRLLYMVILLMTATITLAQSFEVRECSEAELPRSKRERYFVQTEQFLNNYYMHLLNLEDNIVQESFVGLVYSDRNAATLIPEFARHGILSVRMKPKQYLLELEKSLDGLVMDELDFKVDNVTHGKIMMNSLVSCYIPVDYDLTLMKGDRIVFKRRCRMYGLFEDIRNYMDVKLMQVEPVKELVTFTDSSSTDDNQAISQPGTDTPVAKQYDFINPASEGLAMVRLGLKHGYIDAEGNEIIPLVYQTGYPFWAGLAAVRYGGQWGFINTKNQSIIPFIYDTYIEARKQISKIANNGNANAQLLMGYWHYYGRENYKQNFKISLQWFRLAADAGMKEAAYYLGFQYENAQGTDKDVNNAKFWYAKAKGYADADARLEQLVKQTNGTIALKQKKKESKSVIYYAIDKTLGATMAALDKRTKKDLSLTGGIKIMSVREGRLKKAGCGNEFVVFKANDSTISNIRDLQNEIERTKNSPDKVLFLQGIYTNGKKANYAIDLNE